MQTDKRAQRNVMALGILGVILGLVTVTVVLVREHAPGNMIPGFLVGLGVGIAAALVMAWRVLRRPERATILERAWTQTGDEREDTLLTRALAVVGLVSLPLIGIATLAIGFGAEPPMVMTLLMGTLFVTGAGSFTVISHRS
jgi:drug/metabolite transporter (DMT)-like permease